MPITTHTYVTKKSSRHTAKTFLRYKGKTYVLKTAPSGGLSKSTLYIIRNLRTMPFDVIGYPLGLEARASLANIVQAHGMALDKVRSARPYLFIEQYGASTQTNTGS